ncbi:endonuclease domain-containing protein [Qipengyuania sp. DY56-A-20]|uniref:Endonuclease domain-containing protein n=2 Tax=Qipengyuania benthica TaxID=3067651 RepID=A0ABT9H6Y5_9SPHN|nr:endonuclease domain-containing protein [Qipengyuania sp. DY56-A-20]MDP4538988.1 endonuclease domain-containing protein [Qipengyuania sp. DY56-A-20]
MQDHSSKALQRARKLRSTMSLPEVLLWNRLRGNPMGVKFRKQHPLGDYVIDFFRASKRIAVEIDGIAHDRGNRPMRDSSRDAWLRRQGVEVLRIPAAEVLRDVAAVADAVVRYCADPPPPSAAGAAATSPRGGGFLGVTG